MKSIFKNDKFNIKFKIFDLKMNHLIKSEFKLRTKALYKMLKYINKIGIPANEDDYKSLKLAINFYDENIKELESNLHIAREYIKNMKKENNT